MKSNPDRATVTDWLKVFGLYLLGCIVITATIGLIVAIDNLIGIIFKL